MDEDFKRYYPYDRLASRVLGFTGSDNQGIIGLEVKYEDVLKRNKWEDTDGYRCQRNRVGRGCGGPD